MSVLFPSLSESRKGGGAAGLQASFDAHRDELSRNCKEHKNSTYRIHYIY
jgi:hypothetical protein